VSDPSGYYGLAAVFVDVDDDGWVDLAVANDSVAQLSLLQSAQRDIGRCKLRLGICSERGGGGSKRPWVSVVGDYNRDGKVDLFTTTFSDDYKTLYRNDGGDSFSDVTYRTGLAGPTIPFWLGEPVPRL